MIIQVNFARIGNMLNIILGIVIAICLMIMVGIVISKFPKIRLLDVNTVPEEKHDKVRQRLLYDRMKRSTEKSQKALQKGVSPLFKKMSDFFSKLFKKIYALERKYQLESRGKSAKLKGESLTQKTATMLQEAEQQVKDENYGEAEKKYIELISLDPACIKAYKGLADVYSEQKDYKQALQTAGFVLKLEKKNSKAVEKKDEHGRTYTALSNAHELADAHIDLGFVYQMMEKNEQALEHYNSAYELEPNNPRNLDQLLQICIIMKDKNKAMEVWQRLRQVNPENQKLKEYEEKIADFGN